VSSHQLFVALRGVRWVHCSVCQLRCLLQGTGDLAYTAPRGCFCCALNLGSDSRPVHVKRTAILAV
jgi:hypothetical protein